MKCIVIILVIISLSLNVISFIEIDGLRSKIDNDIFICNREIKRLKEDITYSTPSFSHLNDRLDRYRKECKGLDWSRKHMDMLIANDRKELFAKGITE